MTLPAPRPMIPATKQSTLARGVNANDGNAKRVVVLERALAVGVGGIGVLTEHELAFNADEATLVLSSLGHADTVAQINAALDRGRASPDEAVRKEAYAEVQRRQTALVPYIWLAHTQWAIGT